MTNRKSFCLQVFLLLLPLRHKIIPEEVIPYGAEYLLEMEEGKNMETVQDRLLPSEYSLSLPLFYLHWRGLLPLPIDVGINLINLI